MNLIVDQGNTATKLAIFDSEKKITSKVIFLKKDQKLTEDWIAEKIESVNAIIVSSVTNNVLRINHPNLIVFNDKTPIPIINKYKTPETLGKDRLANAIAIWALNPHKPSMAIDMGTCIKYDLVSEKGEYLGGNISPGMNMRYESLHAFTDQLPRIEPADFEYNFGDNTETSILNGVQHAINHEINGFIQRYTEQFGQLTIFMTGGDVKYFDKGFKSSIFAFPNQIGEDLTLYGLNEILNYNVEL